MSSHNAEERQRLEELVKDYRRTWSHYIEEVEALRRAGDANASSAEALEVRARVDGAAAEYRRSRDELAAALLTVEHAGPVRLSTSVLEEVLSATCGGR